jgi:hypothetical protein
LAGAASLIFAPIKGFTRRSAVEKIWYDSNRDGDDKMPNSLAVRLSNGLALLILAVVISNPIWSRVPKALTPWSSPIGKARYIAGFFICHFGLLLWPLTLGLIVNLVRQKHWTGVTQSLALIAVCCCTAWGATEGVIRLWTMLGHWSRHFYGV